MSNAKRRTLIIVQAILVVLFVIAIIGLSIGNAKADVSASDLTNVYGSDIASAGRAALNQIESQNLETMSHNASQRYTGRSDVKVLYDAGEVQTFLQGGYPGIKIGYLDRNITSFSWNNGTNYQKSFTSKFMAHGLTFDGNGYSITLDPTMMNSSTSTENVPWVDFGDIYNEAKNTYFRTNGEWGDMDLNGCFIGYVPEDSSIINTKFIFNSKVFTYRGGYADGVTMDGSDGGGSASTTSNSGAQSTGASGCGGLVAAYCSGVIDNCSIEMKENTYVRMLKEASQNTKYTARKSYALGGMVGVLAGQYARVSNCSVDLKGGSLLYVEMNSAKASNTRAYVGGLIGWMGDSSNAYNLYCTGTGTLRATGSNTTATPDMVGFAGIAVGSCASQEYTNVDAAMSGTNQPGIVNGVFSSWTGTAYFRTSDATYSPWNTGSNSTDQQAKGIIVGFSGNQGYSTEMVTGIYCFTNTDGSDPYAQSGSCTIGYSYSGESTNSPRGIIRRNLINPTESIDSATAYSNCVSKVNFYFSTNESDSDVWVTYDLSGDSNHIFWAVTTDKDGGISGATATTVYDNYFAKYETAEYAQKFDYLYIPLVRNKYSKVDIKFEIGRAMVYSLADVTNTASSTTLPSVVYGQKLTLPTVTLSYPSIYDTYTETVKDKYNYFKLQEVGATAMKSADGYQAEGTYRLFVYTDQFSGEGFNYDDIDLLDTDARIVTYIQDNAVYKAYKNAHSSYEYIDSTGRKDYNWQKIYSVTVTPKASGITFTRPTGMNIPISGGRYQAPYQGGPIVFTANVTTTDIQTQAGDSSVGATLGYYKVNDFATAEADLATYKDNLAEFAKIYEKVNSATNIGNYIIVAESLSSHNYSINTNGTTTGQVGNNRSATWYINLEVQQRPTTVLLNPDLVEGVDYEKVGSDVFIKLGYNGLEQLIKYASGPTEPKESDWLIPGVSSSAPEIEKKYYIYFYNVLEADAGMVQIDVVGMDGGEYFDATDVPESGAGGSYQIVISFADGTANTNYTMPNITRIIVEIEPVEINFESASGKETQFTYGYITPESDRNGGYYAFALDVNDSNNKVAPTNAQYLLYQGSLAYNQITDWWTGYNWQNYVWYDNAEEWLESDFAKQHTDWTFSADSPRNVGIYLIIYQVSNEVERNYTTTSMAYLVEIVKRNVDFSFTDEDLDGEHIYGRDYAAGMDSAKAYYTPGMGDDEDMLAGKFATYSYDPNTGVSSGMSTSHSADTRVGYRYQRIGDYGYDGTFTVFKDMDDIDKLPAVIQDAGKYIIYPILLFKQSNGGYEYVSAEARNYNFDLDYREISIAPLEVEIVLNYSFTSEYSKEIPDVNRAANVEADRVWTYADNSNVFLDLDDIKVVLDFDKDNITVQSTVGTYTVYYDECIGKYSTLEGLALYNKASNYVVNCTGAIELEITKLAVDVRTFAYTSEMTYGDELTQFASYQVEGENKFAPFDNMQPVYKYYLLGSDEECQPINVGTYSIGIAFDNDNYDINVINAANFTIKPLAISIKDVDVDESQINVTYDGKVHYPTINSITFDKVVDGDDITVSFVFYDENNKVVENPQNAGTYTANIANGAVVLNKDDLSVNPNYVLNADGFDYEIKVTIAKLDVEIKVADATMLYMQPGTLTRNADESADFYIESGMFIEDMQYKLVPYSSSYSEGTHLGGVNIEFVDESNYNIKINKGTLTVKSNNLSDLKDYVYVTYDGNKYEDVKDSVIYTGGNLFGKFGFTSDLLDSKLLSYVIATDANGVNTVREIVNANTYYMIITADGDNSMTGKLVLEFAVALAPRTISASDVKIEVHYNKLIFSSSIANLLYSVNGSAFAPAGSNNVYEFTDVSPLSNYFIQVKLASDGNYAESNVLNIYTTTGINAGELVDQINAIEKITFSNVATYRALLERLDKVSEADKSLIDYDKIAQLDKSLEQLIAQANAVIAGAHSVTAKAVGKGSGSTAAMSLALATSSVSAVGLMFGLISVKKRKEETVEDVNENKTVKRASGRKTSKAFVAIVAVVVIAIMLLAGCSTDSFTQEQTLDIASFKTPSNESSREYEITVSYGSDLVYRNVNGEVTSIDLITPPAFNLSSSGSGFDFNIDYFTNVSYVASQSTATFSADVENVSAFLGRANAENAKVTVVVDVVNERLNKIEISYEEDGFYTHILSTMVY